MIFNFILYVRHGVSPKVIWNLSTCCLCYREGPGFSYGLNWALAGRGVIVKDKAFYNMKSSELQKSGATTIGSTKFSLIPFSCAHSICDA